MSSPTAKNTSDIQDLKVDVARQSESSATRSKRLGGRDIAEKAREIGSDSAAEVKVLKEQVAKLEGENKRLERSGSTRP
jgi:hypothetical protein